MILLMKVFEKASKLPDDLQDEIAKEFTEEIEWEVQWDNTLSKSQDRLDQMAQIPVMTWSSNFVGVVLKDRTRDENS